MPYFSPSEASARVAEYPGVLEVVENALICKVCKKQIASNKVAQHLKGKKHIEQSKCTRAVSDKTSEEFVLDTVFMLTSAGIPLEKLDHIKGYFEKWIPAYSGMLPSSNHCRRAYLPKLLSLHRAAMMDFLKGMIGCSVITDESSDKRKQSPVNLMIVPAQFTQFQKPSLIDIHFVEESNNGYSINVVILEEFILKMCQDYEIPKKIWLMRLLAMVLHIILQHMTNLKYLSILISFIYGA
jgi:hypothetical protein